MQIRREPGSTLHFRPLSEPDFPLLLEWLERPHMQESWDNTPYTLERVAQDYGAQTPTHKRFILLYQTDSTAAQPIGYLEYIITDDQVARLYQFIGEADKLDRGLGTQALKQFLDFIRARHSKRAATVDPEPENRRAIRCYEKVGFRHDPALPSPPEHESYMMKLEF